MEYYDEIESELSETTNLNENFNQFLDVIRSNFNKKKYKKSFKDLVSQEKIFQNMKNAWKIYEFKLTAVLKIIHKKIFIKDNKKFFHPHTKPKNLHNWIKTGSEIITEWEETLEKNEQFPIYIKLYLQFLYYNIIYCTLQDQLYESIALLNIGEKIIRIYVDKCTNPDVLNISQKILLFLSSYLISDKNFESAKMHQNNILKLAIRELYLRTDKRSTFEFEHMNKQEVHIFHKIFKNLSICLYHRGVSEENQNNLLKAWECYRQSNWLSKNFLKSLIPEYVQFMSDLEDKAAQYSILMKNLETESIKFTRVSEKPIKKKKVKKNEIFNNIKNYVENLQIKDLDFNENKTNSDFIMSTINLTNKLLSSKFKDLVNNLKDLKIFDIVPETEEMIKRKITHTKSDGVFKEKFWARSGSIVSSSEINNIRIDKLNQDLSKYIDRRQKNQSGETFAETNHITHKRGKSAISLNSFNKIQNNKIHTIKEDVEKISYNYYVFSPSFKSKINFYEKLNKKEIKYQKKLLKSKKLQPNLPYEIKDLCEIEKDAEMLFNNIRINKCNITGNNKNLNTKEETIFSNPESYKQERKKENLEMKVIKSLNTKSFTELTNLMKSKETRITLRDEFLQKDDKSKKFNPEKMKNTIVNEINSKLDCINEKKLTCKMIINPTQFKEKEYVPRKLLPEIENPGYQAEDFISKFTEKKSSYNVSSKKIT